jgi:hypothetical protein
VAHADGSFNDPAADTPMLYAAQGDHGPLAWSQALLDADERVIGVVAARGGELPRTEWYRSDRGTRWRDVLERLLAAATAAGYDRGVTRGRRGTIQILPTRAGLLYVQSFYDWPADAEPSLTGVAVYDGASATTGPTLAQALGVARTAQPSGTGAFRSRVNQLYEAMSTALRLGDWPAFGAAYSALGRLLRAER